MRHFWEIRSINNIWKPWDVWFIMKEKIWPSPMCVSTRQGCWSLVGQGCPTCFCSSACFSAPLQKHECGCACDESFQSGPPCCDPMDCSQEYWRGLPRLPGDLSDPGIEPESPADPVLQVDSLPPTTREALWIPVLPQSRTPRLREGVWLSWVDFIKVSPRIPCSWPLAPSSY